MMRAHFTPERLILAQLRLSHESAGVNRRSVPKNGNPSLAATGIPEPSRKVYSLWREDRRRFEEALDLRRSLTSDRLKGLANNMKLTLCCAAVLLSLSLAAGEAPKDNPIFGVWKNKADPSIILHFQPYKVGWLQNGLLQFGLVKYDADKVTIWIYGKKKMIWSTDFDEQELILTSGGKPSPWVKHADVPKEMEIPVVKIGETKEIPTAKLKELQTALKEKAGQLASMSKDATLGAQREKLVAEIATLLKGTVMEFGWIDAKRFGKPTAEAAFDLLQKCGDVPLLVAVLPELQKEALAGNLAGMDFARFFDRTKLAIGERQKYGTQLGKTEAGQLLVLPVEDRAKVDEFRKELKLSPLAADKDLNYEEGW
jgi:hypothetical protein